MDAILFAVGAIGAGVLCAITGFVLGDDYRSKQIMRGLSVVGK